MKHAIMNDNNFKHFKILTVKICIYVFPLYKHIHKNSPIYTKRKKKKCIFFFHTKLNIKITPLLVP